MDMTIYKLDQAGNPPAGINEYHYRVPPASQLCPVNLSLKTGSLLTDIGLHAYADNNARSVITDLKEGKTSAGLNVYPNPGNGLNDAKLD